MHRESSEAIANPPADSATGIDPAEPVNSKLLPSIGENNIENQQSPKTRKDRILEYIRVLAPHLGLIVLLTLYLLIGTTFFYYIEAPHEVATRESQQRALFALKDSFHDSVWEKIRKNSTTAFSRESFDAIGDEYFEKLAGNFLEAYRNQLFTNERHLLNRTNDNEAQLWSYRNSLFFSTTVITTIGCGSLIPATELGRACCIFFALFGIPLFLVTVADIAKFLSGLLHSFYRSCRRFKTKNLAFKKQSNRKKNQTPEVTNAAGNMELNELEAEPIKDESNDEFIRIPVILLLFALFCYCAIGALVFRLWEGWSFFKAFYFCFITLTTVGFGTIVPVESSIFAILAYIFVGLSFTTMCVDLAGTEYIRKIHYLGQKITDAKRTLVDKQHQQMDPTQPTDSIADKVLEH